MVVVAHRLATVQNADVVFVLGEVGCWNRGIMPSCCESGAFTTRW